MKEQSLSEIIYSMQNMIDKAIKRQKMEELLKKWQTRLDELREMRGLGFYTSIEAKISVYKKVIEDLKEAIAKG